MFESTLSVLPLVTGERQTNAGVSAQLLDLKQQAQTAEAEIRSDIGLKIKWLERL